ENVFEFLLCCHVRRVFAGRFHKFGVHLQGLQILLGFLPFLVGQVDEGLLLLRELDSRVLRVFLVLVFVLSGCEGNEHTCEHKRREKNGKAAHGQTPEKEDDNTIVPAGGAKGKSLQSSAIPRSSGKWEGLAGKPTGGMNAAGYADRAAPGRG